MNHISAGKGKEDGVSTRKRERSFKTELGEEGVTKQKMKRDIKELELEEVRPITGFGVFFKDAWDRWQLQTISHRRAASSLEEIRGSSSLLLSHTLLTFPLCPPSSLFLPSWGSPRQSALM